MNFMLVIIGCVLLISQIEAAEDLEEFLQSGITTDEKLSNPTAQQTIDNLMRYIEIVLKSEAAGQVLRNAATNFRIVLINQNGQDNVMAILNGIVYMLKSPYISQIILTICDEMVQFASDEISGRKVLKTYVQTYREIFEHPNILPFAKGLMSGSEALLDGMSPQVFANGVNRLRLMSSILPYIKPLAGQSDFSERLRIHNEEQRKVKTVSTSVPTEVPDLEELKTGQMDDLNSTVRNYASLGQK